MRGERKEGERKRESHAHAQCVCVPFRHWPEIRAGSWEGFWERERREDHTRTRSALEALGRGKARGNT